MSRDEIERLYIRWMEEFNGDYSNAQGGCVDVNKVLAMKELAENPFRYRIGRVFGIPKGGVARKTERRRLSAIARKVLDKDECNYLVMDFEAFVNMVNVFSAECDVGRKAEYAFKIYDFDDDGIISVDDIMEVIACMLGQKGEMSKPRVAQCAKQVMAEADDNHDLSLSILEFRRLMKKLPNFTTRFQFSVTLPSKPWW